MGIFQEDLVGIVDCPEPDRLSVSDRRVQRLEAEKGKFDDDHYLLVLLFWSMLCNSYLQNIVFS